jgi:thiol-disulfide isomerase/thioredoxin
MGQQFKAFRFVLMAMAALVILATLACSGNASDSATGSAVRSYSYGGSEPTQQDAGGETELPEPAADAIYDFDINFYQGQDIVGGDVVPVSGLQGQPVVLNFWAGLCPPCRAEMPEFQSFADAYADRALVVGVDLGQFFSLGSQDDATRLLNELSVTYPAGYTDDGNLARELEILGLPATFFINADGSVHRQWQGPLNEGKLAEITDEMLNR